MRWIADIVMRRRARALFARLAPHLPRAGTIADIGSGTGHNAAHIQRQTALCVCEFDVADMHWIGAGPTLMPDDSIPAHDCRFSSLLMLFVLQYVESVPRLLQESRRVAEGPVIVLQSTYSGAWGRCVLRMREFFWGRGAYAVAALVRLVSGAA
ncbi:MAG TPA: methyltransferase domain-containing protein, partial [Planctomycetaceae bacterium]|nr:methyltransferase domain-containing protein [Planctomycetaceae bacterium]